MEKNQKCWQRSTTKEYNLLHGNPSAMPCSDHFWEWYQKWLLQGMMDGFPCRSGHDNACWMCSHAETSAKVRTDSYVEMTRDKDKKSPMINVPLTRDKWTNDPWLMDQWPMINGPMAHDKLRGWEVKNLLSGRIYFASRQEIRRTTRRNSVRFTVVSNQCHVQNVRLHNHEHNWYPSTHHHPPTHHHLPTRHHHQQHHHYNHHIFPTVIGFFLPYEMTHEKWGGGSLGQHENAFSCLTSDHEK